MKKLLTFLCFLLLCGQVGAATYYASPSGATTNCATMQNIATPASSFQAALNCANQGATGDTIILRAGVYTGNADPTYAANYLPKSLVTSVNQRLTIQNYSGEIATLRPSTCQSAIFTNRSSLSNNQGYVTIDGSQGLTLGQQYGIVFDGINCWLGDYDPIKNPSGAPGSSGIVMSEAANSNGWLIRNIEIKNTSYTCTSGMHDMTIQYSSCHDLRNVNWNQGIDSNGGNVIFEYNDVYNVGAPGDVGGAGAIHGCSHSNSPGCPNTTIRFNRIHETKVAISAYFMDGSKIYGNIIYNSNVGIYVRPDAGTVAVNNNTIYHIGYQSNLPHAYSGYAMYIDSPTATARNNISYDRAAGDYFDSGVAHDHNLTADPLFVNAPASDFHLLSNSPAINAGANLGSPYNLDIAGIDRGATWDIGAYEFITATITITSPTTSPTYITSSGTVTVQGTASCPTTITSVTWSNNRGGSGTATGTTGWSVPNISLTANRVNDLTFTVNCR